MEVVKHKYQILSGALVESNGDFDAYDTDLTRDGMDFKGRLEIDKNSLSKAMIMGKEVVKFCSGYLEITQPQPDQKKSAHGVILPCENGWLIDGAVYTF